MKIIFQIILISLLSFSVCGQNSEYIVHFHNYSQSSVLTVNGVKKNKILYKAYGEIEMNSKQLNYQNRYLFQSQEYESSLGLYFYPKRLYAFKEKRFLQPDPLSQYFSPYLFVQADPVNFIDLDGNEGKPLVLYFEDHQEPEGLDLSMRDFKAQMPDAYYSPMSDFLNRDIGDLPDWDGNIFIRGHMRGNEGSEVAVEWSKNKEQLKTKTPIANRYEQAFKGKYQVDIDARKLGSNIRQFSEERGVPVRTIIAGGCQGHSAAERIGQGFVERSDRLTGRSLMTAGLKEGRNAFISGRLEVESRRKGGVTGIDETRFQVKPKGAKTSRVTEMRNGKRTFVKYRGEMEDGSVHDYKYAGGAEFRNLVDGRIPESVSNEFDQFIFKY